MKKPDYPFRVLQITGGMNRGGAETMIMNIYRNLDRELIQFDFISFHKEKCHYDDEIFRMGGRIFYCPPPKQIGPFEFIKKLKMIILNEGPFIAAHAHTLHNIGFSLIAARIGGVTNRISHSHSTSNKGNKLILRNLYFNIARYLIRKNSTNMLACGKEAALYLYGDKTVNLGKVAILPNAIDLKQFESLDKSMAESMRGKLGIPNNVLVLGHIGRFVPVKNQGFFIDLAKILKEEGIDFRIVLVGDGPLRPEIEEKVRKNNLTSNILFLGIRSDIPELLNMFDIFLLPSFYEGLPVVLVEAQAAGTPCIVSASVTKESDMGVGLVNFENIGNIVAWTNLIKDVAKFNILPKFTILNGLDKKGFNVERNCEILTQLYLAKS